MSERVYIEGMKMPSCCAECPLTYSVRTQTGPDPTCVFRRFHTEWGGEKKSRAEGCPLRVEEDKS